MKTNKIKFACVGIIATSLAGCASTAQIQKEMYSQRLAEQSKVDQQKNAVEAARYVYAAKLSDPSAQLAFAISDGIASALRASGAGQTQLPPMPLIEGWDDKLLKFAGILAPVAANIAGNVLQYKSTVAQSDNATRLGIAQTNAAAATTASTNSTFASFGSNLTATAGAGFAAVRDTASAGFAANTTISGQGFAAATSLGNNIQGTATAGFASNASIAASGYAAMTTTTVAGYGAVRELGLKPTTSISGDGNNIITGTGNTTQSGTGNRQGSAGPCTSGNGGNQTGTATPGVTTTVVNKDGSTTTTTTPTTSGTGGAGGGSDCSK